MYALDAKHCTRVFIMGSLRMKPYLWQGLYCFAWHQQSLLELPQDLWQGTLTLLSG